ncbi:MAG TPA: hypothetical protein VJ302_08500 [Blastocatellia bacterium]|nr:hypothetical protein [Blastocatellia bacterium]
MLRYQITTDFNGIVIFEPHRLKQFFGGRIAEGTDLFTTFMSSDDGDEVIKQGIIIPILAIDDAGYSIEFYLNEKSARPQEQIVFENGIFPLYVEKQLVLADLVVLKEWIENLGWTVVDVPSGYYQVTIRGFKQENRLGHLTDCGYEVFLDSTTSLPQLTATLEINSRVLIPPS